VYLGAQHDHIIKVLEEYEQTIPKIWAMYDSAAVARIGTIDTQAETIQILSRVNEQKEQNLESAFALKRISQSELSTCRANYALLEKALEREKRRKKFWRSLSAGGIFVGTVTYLLLKP